ncbi:M13 family peptidase, partial [Oxalobacteraceae bacterium OM1]
MLFHRFVLPRRALRLAAFLCAIAAPVAPAFANDAPSPPLAGMDLKARPGDDFYRYVNGGWMDSTQIPADRSHWGVGSETAERVDRQVAELIRQAAESPADGDIKRVGDFYQAYLDEAVIEAKGLAPVRDTFVQIDAIRDRRTLSRVLGSRLRADVDPLNNSVFHTPNPIGLWVAQGLHDPSRYTAYLLQGGLGMPEREYYLGESPRMQEVRAKYRQYVATL